MTTYTHMLISKITGGVICRATSEESAMAHYRRLNSGKRPVEIRTYCDHAYKANR